MSISSARSENTGLLSSTLAPELTVRAVVTGMVIGAVLTPCNVYSGLKIGWTFNMSVAAGLIAFGAWSVARNRFDKSPLALGENNINQTAASAAASIISAGLAAPIPALAILTGRELAYPVLVAWLAVVSLLGVMVASGLRNQMLLRERLPFPSGVVTAATMKEIHSGGPEARARLRLLGLAALFSAALKAVTSSFAIGPLAPSLKFALTMPLAKSQTTVTALNLGLALDPSALLFGFGVISGLRIGVSAGLGAVIAWVVLAPVVLQHGWVAPGPDNPDAVWFGPLVEWLLWPGATLMVVAALTAIVLSLTRLARASWVRARKTGGDLFRDAANVEPASPLRDKRMLSILVLVMALCVAAQMLIFDIEFWIAVLAVLLSYVLAIVAARVSGETAITPIGALGKITQLTFGVLSPGQVSTNLMTANVTGGAAGQCADLMHDLRTGQIIGATPNFQIVAQIFGVLTGAFAAALAYRLLIPDPQTQLISAEWPAPAVAIWKAVAEAMSRGLTAMPTGALPAIAIAAVVGIGFSLVESLLPPAIRRFVPSASAIGLGFVIPAYNSFSLFAGSAIAALIVLMAPNWAERRLIVLAAGLIVGESLAGVIGALASVFGRRSNHGAALKVAANGREEPARDVVLLPNMLASAFGASE